MCGITGFLKLKNCSGSGDWPVILKSMNQTLIHRGPDDDGYLIEDPVYLGMRRLKIIDLATGKQPIHNEDGKVSVVFNGEIYNYVELRQELQAKGHRFATASDTEVLVHLYEEEGELFPRRLRGMFAFALWDRERRRLVLGRDHFGIKPLFWGIYGGNLIFGSEIKAIRRHPNFERRLNPQAADDFLTLLFIPTPKTIYQDLYKLEPGTVLVAEPGNRAPRKAVYWNPRERLAALSQNRMTNLGEIEERLSAKISECVKMMLRSDVPLGVFLSGGLDSTTTAYFASKHNANLETFTIYFKEESYSERQEAGATARLLGTRHREIPMDFPKNLADFAWKVLSHFDEPFGDLSALPTYLLCQTARRHITVALSGDGGDELFGGYPTTIATQALAYYRRLPSWLRTRFFPALARRLPTSLERVSWDYKIKRFVLTAQHVTDLARAHFAWRSALYWHQREELYAPEFFRLVSGQPPFGDIAEALSGMNGLALEDQLMFGDLRVYLPDLYLVKADMMSMAHSLELRPCLLDPELAELSFAIPPNFKVRGWQTKWIIRHMMKDRLPPEVISMPKKGFTPPLAFWLLEKGFQDFVRQSIRGPLRDLRIVREDTVDQWLSEHASRQVDHTRRLWAVLSLASFAEKNAAVS